VLATLCCFDEHNGGCESFDSIAAADTTETGAAAAAAAAASLLQVLASEPYNEATNFLVTFSKAS
jgi:hypothetical protein